MKPHARVVIVGSGIIMGVGLLYHLALEGQTGVVLVEKGADLRFDMACGRTVPAFQFVAQYDEGSCLRHQALPKVEELTGQTVS
jgi:dimethylglycine dehydrogenase